MVVFQNWAATAHLCPLHNIAATGLSPSGPELREPRFEFSWGFPGGSEVKAAACNAGDLGSNPGLVRSPGEGNGNPLQYSCLEDSMAEEPGGLYSLWETSLSLSEYLYSIVTFGCSFKIWIILCYWFLLWQEKKIIRFCMLAKLGRGGDSEVVLDGNLVA